MSRFKIVEHTDSYHKGELYQVSDVTRFYDEYDIGKYMFDLDKKCIQDYKTSREGWHDVVNLSLYDGDELLLSYTREC